MKRGGPLKRSDKPMSNGGLPAPTKAQEALFRKLSDQIGCVVCLFYCRHDDGSRVEGSIAQIHHLLSGGNRISHWHVIPLCKMHHDDGKPGNPSFHSIMGKYGKEEFERTYATEMELVIQCEEWINQPYVTGLLTDEQAHQREETAQAQISDDRDPNPDANMEPDIGYETKRSDEIEAFTETVCLDFVHYRHRLADPDGLSVKAVIDGIVEAGLLRNDTCKEIEAISHRQIKIPRAEEERTLLTITEVVA